MYIWSTAQHYGSLCACVKSVKGESESVDEQIVSTTERVTIDRGKIYTL